MELFSQLYWIRRFGSTKRFHGIRLQHEDIVAHHSANVALIIVQTFRNPSGALLKAALMHDLPEGVTGDIPAPVKWVLCSDGANLNDLEKKIFDYYCIEFPKLAPDEVEMLKAADFIDAVFTLLLERANGNREVDWVFRNYDLFEEKSQLLDSFPTLKELWKKIRFSYTDLMSQKLPPDLLVAEYKNFWNRDE